MARRFFVVDGADRGRSFLLPEQGTAVVGNSRKNTDICLHDLYVARVHCEVEVQDGLVVVYAHDTPTGTLVNGERVKRQVIQPGDVVRVGNSHLRLDEAPSFAADEPEEEPAALPKSSGETGRLPNLSPERLKELSGHRLAHFEVGPVLGVGQHGVVFRANDTKAGEPVALKVLAPVFPSNDDEMNHFVRVMKKALPVRHECLRAVHGVGKSGPYVWFACDLVLGYSAAALTQRAGKPGKLKWRAALRVATHLARALEFLRDLRYVHGNITPANVLIPDDADSPALVTDFALAHALAGSDLEAWRRQAKYHAELPFLSPEHVIDDAPVDDLSDQYSVGAVVYDLLTGCPPAAGRTPEEVAESVRTGRPTKPKEIAKAVPDEFQAVVLRMLAKRPEDRYPSPKLLLADLEPLAAKEPI